MEEEANTVPQPAMDVEDGEPLKTHVADTALNKKRAGSNETDDHTNVLPSKRQRKIPSRFIDSSSKKKGIQDPVVSSSDMVDATLKKRLLSKLKSSREKYVLKICLSFKP